MKADRSSSLCPCGLPYLTNPDTGTQLCAHCDNEHPKLHPSVRCPECAHLEAVTA